MADAASSVTDEAMGRLREFFAASEEDGYLPPNAVSTVLKCAGLKAIMPSSEEFSALVGTEPLSLDDLVMLVYTMAQPDADADVDADADESEQYINKHGSLNSNVSLEPLSDSSSDDLDDDTPEVTAAMKRAAEDMARQRMAAAQAGVEGDMERLALDSQQQPPSAAGRSSGRKASFDYSSVGRRLSTDL